LRKNVTSTYILQLLDDLFGNWVGAIKKTVFATEQDRADVKEARQVWKDWQTTCDPSACVSGWDGSHDGYDPALWPC